VPSGLLLLSLGVVYAVLSASLCSDNRMIVLFRRELAAFFYSPLAYIVLISFALISWWFFWQFVATLYGRLTLDEIMEPVITRYLLTMFPIICVIVTVPVLTMRLLSEEHRTGTLEVLLTAPVGEGTVVLSKFLAALVFYLLIWAPWGLCLIALRIEGGQPFEYRPLLSFYIMVACTGAAFLSMGLFFSSLTRSQIAAAILTFVGMLLLTVTYFAKELLAQTQPTAASGWVPVLTHISYLELWITSLFGEITPKFYVFPLSATVLWLFLTTKVLESRKWR
jgi:ABC-type transport system involved in multi-copper enzyme maturation permease subunit